MLYKLYILKYGLLPIAANDHSAIARRGSTAAAVGPGAARRGAWGARTALGHRRRRGAQGGGRGGMSIIQGY